MNSILARNEEYVVLSSSALYEAEYEEVLAEAGERLFPGSWLVPFKASVSSEHGTRKPDLALIDRKYRKWYVVEAELAHHSLTQHVLPQVTVLAAGTYGREHADVLASESGELSKPRLREMMLGEPPGVIVLVNEARPEWVAPLKEVGASLGVVRVYRSMKNRHALLARLEVDAVATDLVSVCSRHPGIPRLWSVRSPGALPGGQTDDTLTLLLEGAVTEWKRIVSADTVWLAPKRADPFEAAVTEFEIHRGTSDTLVIDIK